MKNEKVTILSSPSSVTGLWFIFASLLGIVWLLAAFLLSPFFGYIAMALVALAITLLVAGRIVQKKGVEVEEDEVIAIKFFNYFIFSFVFEKKI